MKKIIKYYSDLDDTITDNSCLFYSKILILKKLKDFDSNKNEYFNILLSDFKINKNFLKLIEDKNIKEIFILSRNDNDFVQFFIKNFNKKYLDKYKIKIIGGIGKIDTEDKMKYIDGKGIMISDIFEYKILKKYDNFISVDKYSLLSKNKIILKKIVFLLKFIKKLGKMRK